MNNKAVRFGSISIREYDVICGDNPSCSCGPPVSLDWSYEAANERQVDEYERYRPERRSLVALSMSASERWLMLLDKHSPQELDNIVQEISRLRRAQTAPIPADNHAPKEWMEPCVLDDETPSKPPKKLKNFFTFIVKGKSTFRKLRRHSSENSTASTASMEDDELLDDSLEDSRDYTSQHVDDFEDSPERDDICMEDELFV